jgi:hypothetical protein
LNWIWLIVPVISVITLIFALSLGKAAKEGDEITDSLFQKFLEDKHNITSGCPVENNK